MGVFSVFFVCLGEKLKLAIEDFNRPTPSLKLEPTRSISTATAVAAAAPNSPLHRDNSSRHDSYHSHHDRRYPDEGDRDWDRYDSRRYSRSRDDYHRSSSSRYYDDYRYRDDRPSSRYGSGYSRYSSPRRLDSPEHHSRHRSRWDSPGMDSPDSRYRSRSRSRSRSMDRRDSYYRYDDDYYGRESSSRRRSEYWDEQHGKKPTSSSATSQSRPILAISKNCLPFIRGALEDLKKIYYYYNCIDVRFYNLTRKG